MEEVTPYIEDTIPRWVCELCRRSEALTLDGNLPDIFCDCQGAGHYNLMMPDRNALKFINTMLGDLHAFSR